MMNENKKQDMPKIDWKIPYGQVLSDKENKRYYTELRVEGKGIELVYDMFHQYFSSDNYFSVDAITLNSRKGFFIIDLWATGTQKAQVLYYLSTFDDLIVEES